MKQCRQGCIHEEACRMYAENSDYWNDSEDCSAYKSTADVAPKSEVEKLQAEVDRLLELVGTIPPDRVEFVSRTEINAIKENLAREIFEEIEKEVLIAIPINSYIDAPRTTQNKVWNTIYELKKKYTEVKS